MAPIKVYGVPLSSPFRTVIMTCEVLGLDYEIVPTNPLIGETNSPEFLKVLFLSSPIIQSSSSSNIFVFL